MANITAELKQFFGTKTLRMFMGIVKPCSKKNAARIMVPEFKFDERLLAVSFIVKFNSFYLFFESRI